MAEELGKIEKPTADSFKKGRKLFFVPLIFSSQEPLEGYGEKFDRYWEQVENQISELVLKLGEVNRIYHELVTSTGEDGVKAINDLNEKSHKVVKILIGKNARLEALEEIDILTEYMDWNRCLLMGLQNPKVVSKVYDSYVETGKKRNEYISHKIDETLKADEIGVLIMRENHQVQFPSDIQVFFVAPPALDDIKRWLREFEKKKKEE